MRRKLRSAIADSWGAKVLSVWDLQERTTQPASQLKLISIAGSEFLIGLAWSDWSRDGGELIAILQKIRGG